MKSKLSSFNQRNFFLSFIFIFFFLTVAFPAIVKAGEIKHRPCIMLSVPKSGTHLQKKLIMMLTDCGVSRLAHLDQTIPRLSHQEFEKNMLRCKNQHLLVIGHTNPILFNNHFLHFADRHPEYAKIIQVRHLGDAIISLIHFRYDRFRNEMGNNPNFDQILTYFLQCEQSTIARSFQGMLEGALLWLKRPDRLVVQFEDLVGPSGGGTLLGQKKAILRVAKILNVRLTREKFEFVLNNLFGNQVGPESPTFRKGQIGKWKETFKPHHIALFNERWGRYQLALGYDLLE